MNLVLDDACEVHLKKNTRTPLGNRRKHLFIIFNGAIILNYFKYKKGEYFSKVTI